MQLYISYLVYNLIVGNCSLLNHIGHFTAHLIFPFATLGNILKIIIFCNERRYPRWNIKHSLTSTLSSPRDNSLGWLSSKYIPNMRVLIGLKCAFCLPKYIQELLRKWNTVTVVLLSCNTNNTLMQEPLNHLWFTISGINWLLDNTSYYTIYPEHSNTVLEVGN